MKFEAIDHVHVYVTNLTTARAWYENTLGFLVDENLNFWFEQGGPLVMKNHGVMLSLFIRKWHAPGHTVAFRVSASEFEEFYRKLAALNVRFQVQDHQVSWSLYLSDPSENKYEITSYDYTQLSHLKEIN